jgi:metal-responsive CopG/Arc/MetJ family transcriptional regulator
MGKGGKRRSEGTRRKTRVFIGVWVPKSVAAAVDEAIQMSNLDRAKFLRQALEEKSKKKGI